MSQEENKLSWFEAFKKGMNVVFTKEDFKKYVEMVENDLPAFKSYLKTGLVASHNHF